MLRFAGIEAE
jgi:hypothetical protein